MYDPRKMKRIKDKNKNELYSGRFNGNVSMILTSRLNEVLEKLKKLKKRLSY